MLESAYPRSLRPRMFISTGLCSDNNSSGVQLSSWGEIEDGEKGTISPYFEEGCSVVSPIFCPQFTTEAVILKHIQDTATDIGLYFGWQVKSFSQDDSGVELKAVNDNNEEKVFRGRYLVGCDGGASFVRKELGLHMYGKFVVAKACTVFFHSPQLVDVVKTKGCAGLGFVVNPDIQAVTILLNTRGDFAIHVMKPPRTSDEEVDDMVRNPRRCVDAVLGVTGFPYDVVEVAGYNMHGLVTIRFNEGRCFLAGDSAHQWLPAGGLGLNSGISDVADLAWKLEALVKGYGGKHLVESYEIERRPLDDSTRHFAMIATAFIPAIGTIPFVVFTNLLKKSVLLHRIVGFFFKMGMKGSFVTGIDLVLGYQYSNSSIIMHRFKRDGTVSLKSHGFKSSLPGCRAPHVVLPDCSSILDRFGKKFVLLIIGGEVDTDLEDLKAILKQRSVPFEVCGYPSLQELKEVYDRKFLLVRPDGVIAWSSDYQPSIAESSKIVSTVLGHSEPVRLPPQITKFDIKPENLSTKFTRNVLRRYTFMSVLVGYFKMPLPNALAVSGLALTVVGAITVKPPAEYRQKTSRHKAVVIDKYGSAEGVLRVAPKYMGSFGPEDVLIQVYSSSINEIDVQMRQGYGSSSYEKGFKNHNTGSSYFPLVLGRDCSGRVVAVGDNISKFLVGDLVYAVVPPDCPGTHAQLVAVNAECVSLKPCNTDHKEAASLPWVAMTAWNAVVEQAGLNQYNARGKRVLIHDAVCGVSSFAIQLLKAWGAHVTVTCSAEDAALAHRLGADKAIDSQTGDLGSVLCGMDFVLDPIGGNECSSLSVMKRFQQAVYVSTNSPQQRLVDHLGGFLGNFAFSWLYRSKVIFNWLFKGKRFYYANPEADGKCLDEVRVLIEQGSVRPIIDAVYSLDEIIAAHKHVETGQTRGKVVLSIH